ncbi:hypothetical protein [Catellatospora sp. NPDC049609]|uniref:hypothetical protein n=1 Tax=Catellatospora sp. NPDC049609 TaxID=3155505 RepID=UPI00341AA6B3
MTSPPERLTLRTLLRHIVATRSPGELHDVDLIIDAAAAAPGASMRAARRHADPTASGPDLVQEVLTNVYTNLISDAVLLVAGGLLARTAARLRGSRLLRWLPRRRVGPDDALPPLPDAAVPNAVRLIERGALARGVAADDARAIAEIAVAFWRSGPLGPDAPAPPGPAATSALGSAVPAVPRAAVPPAPRPAVPPVARSDGRSSPEQTGS